MAQNSHILIALWDGKPPKSKYGCGTVEVIDFTLDGDYINCDESTAKTVKDASVVWIKSRRQGDGSDADIQKKWLVGNSQRGGENTSKYIASDQPPQRLIELLKSNRKA